MDGNSPNNHLNIELHSFWRSSASYRVRIALNLKAVPYITHPVNLIKEGGEQFMPQYREINPQSRVPTLVHEGQHFRQSLAIVEYLDETFPDHRLMPGDPAGRARVRMLSQIIACDIQPLQNTATTKYLRETLHLDETAVTMWLREWITRGLDAFNAQLARDNPSGKFSHGDTPTMADCCLVPQLYASTRFGIEVARYPRMATKYRGAIISDNRC